MRQPGQLLLATILILFSGALICGCHGTARTEGDWEVRHPTDWDQLVSPRSYWARHDVPRRLADQNINRIVISEFAVEFVENRYLNYFEKLGPLKTDVLSLTPVGVGKSILGIGSRVAEYEPQLLEDIPEQLFEDFQRMIELQGLEVVNFATMKATAAYPQYVTGDVVKSSFKQYLTPHGTDTGRIRRTTIRPVSALPLIVGSKLDDIEEVDARLLLELEADLVIRVRFRVGVFKGRASVESGSVITITGRNVLGSLVSRRSLLSKQSVLKSEGFKPLRGKVYEVHTGKYKLAMQSLFNHYLDLVFEAKE